MNSGMIDAINRNAFELIELVSLKPKEEKKESSGLKGSVKERGVIDWSDKVVESLISRTTDHQGNTLEIFAHDDNGRLGFDKENYPKFDDLIMRLLSLEQFNKVVSYSFIETESFNWIISVYKNQKAESSLYDYLLASVEANVRPITFYFPVFNLEIESPFKIGNTEFTFFTKKYLDEIYESFKKQGETYTEDEFKRAYRKEFQGQVLATVTVTAERNRAEEIAKRDAEISVDVLKMYSESVFFPEMKTMFDLNFRLGYQVESKYLIQEPTENYNLRPNIQFKNIPFYFNQKRLLSASTNGLKVFSDYISLRNKHELDYIIIQAIQLFGSAISNWDIHLRCVSLITILESVLLKDDEKDDMERKAKARLSKSLSSHHDEKERIKSLFTRIYQVRHKMLHKAIRIKIDLKELSEAQRIIINLFLRLIQHYRKGITEKASLIEKLNEIKS